VQQTVTQVTQTVEQTAAPAAQAAAPVVDTVEQTAAPVVQTVAPVVDSAAQTAAPVVQTVDQTATPVVHAAGSTVVPVATATAPVTSAAKPAVQQAAAGVPTQHAAPPAQPLSGTSATPSPTAATGTPEPPSPSPSALPPVDRAHSPGVGPSAGSALPAHRTPVQTRPPAIHVNVADPVRLHRHVVAAPAVPRLPATPVVHFGGAHTPTTPPTAASGIAPSERLPFAPPSSPSGISALLGGASAFGFGSALIAALVLLLALVPPRPGRWLRPPDGLALVPAPLAAFERPG
jgi:hypothetical protein